MFEIFIPSIQPVSDGSIDIYWKTDEYELLVNIPPEIDILVNLYGEKVGSPKDTIDVRIHYNLVELVLVQWFKMIL